MTSAPFGALHTSAAPDAQACAATICSLLPRLHSTEWVYCGQRWTNNRVLLLLHVMHCLIHNGVLQVMRCLIYRPAHPVCKAHVDCSGGGAAEQGLDVMVAASKALCGKQQDVCC